MMPIVAVTGDQGAATGKTVYAVDYLALCLGPDRNDPFAAALGPAALEEQVITLVGHYGLDYHRIFPAQAEGLLKKHPSLKLRDKQGNTALMLAAGNGREDCARTLLARGLDVNRKNRHGDTALFLAAMKGHVDLVKLLLQHKVNPNLRNKKRENARALAAMNHHQGIVAILDAHAEQSGWMEKFLH